LPGRSEDLPLVAEGHVHSFVVKVWLEWEADGGDRAIWRGYVVHVPDWQQRHYITDVDDIADFIGPFVWAMGVPAPRCWRLRRWLKRFRPRGR
jgi:hypothetical protein